MLIRFAVASTLLLLTAFAGLAHDASASCALNCANGTTRVTVVPGNFTGRYCLGRAVNCKADTNGFVTGTCTFEVCRSQGNQVSFTHGWGGFSVRIDRRGLISSVTPRGATRISRDRKTLYFNTSPITIFRGKYRGKSVVTLTPKGTVDFSKTGWVRAFAITNVPFSISNGGSLAYDKIKAHVDGRGNIVALVPVGTWRKTVYPRRRMTLATAPVTLMLLGNSTKYNVTGYGDKTITKQTTLQVLARLQTEIYTYDAANAQVGRVIVYPIDPEAK